MNSIKAIDVTLKNGETYHYRYGGSGSKTMLLVHGNLASSVFFEELMESLSEEYTLYALDLRGFGQSSYHLPIDCIRDFVGDIKLFVDELQLNDFDLLGWSTGGAICMMFSATYGYLVNRLFLMGSVGIKGYPSYRTNEHGEKVLLKTKKEFEEDPVKLRLKSILEQKDEKLLNEVWSSAIYSQKKPSKELFDKHMKESLLQRNLIETYYGLSKYNISDQFNGLTMGTEEVNRIINPTLVIQGIEDLVVSIQDAKEIKRSIGDNAELFLLERCGHAPMIDALDSLIEIILKS